MLALTPVPPQTAGERAFYAELARWETGGAVRAAVVAAIPFTDGRLDRRIADAVLFVPEGVAVVRIAEVPRQAGVVTASPEGAWSIAPRAGPGDVLQLGGGGSTPLDGLMRAGMEVAVRLRQAGLEPGRIARLTVLTGEVSGLVPADGDLGEGDQVALLDPRSLLLGIARCSRYSQVDNPRLWTTADVRAALEALGLEGRSPTVEELNGEGFPYSPYVLRLPELLAPATMAASSPDRPAAGVPSGRTAAAPVPVRQQPSPAAIAHAVAASAAAARAATALEPPAAGQAVGAVAGAPSARTPTTQQAGVQQQAVQRDTVAIDQPDAAAAPAEAGPLGPTAPALPGSAAPATAPQQAGAPPTPAFAPATWPADQSPDDSGGIGGLFAGAEADRDESRGRGRPRTAVLPRQPAAAPAGSDDHEDQHHEDRRHEDRHHEDREDEHQDDERRGHRIGLLIALTLGLVGLLAVAGWLVLRDPDDGVPAAGAGPDATGVAGQGSEAGPQVGEVQDVDGVRYAVEAVAVDDTCVGHSYGDTAAFFATTDCTGLSRALYSAQVDGRAVVLSVSRVRMPDTATARSLQALTDRSGSGNVSDLLREGVTYPGGPGKLTSAQYASAVSGPTVTIVESSWVDPASGGGPAEIDRMADDGLALRVAPFAGE